MCMCVVHMCSVVCVCMFFNMQAIDCLHSNFSLDHSHDKQKQRTEGVTSNDVIGDIFAGMDTLYNKDATVLRSGKIAVPSMNKIN